MGVAPGADPAGGEIPESCSPEAGPGRDVDGRLAVERPGRLDEAAPLAGGEPSPDGGGGEGEAAGELVGAGGSDATDPVEDRLVGWGAAGAHRDSLVWWREAVRVRGGRPGRGWRGRCRPRSLRRSRSGAS